MNGVEMMMKAIGLDPVELRKQIDIPIQQMIGGIQTLGIRLAQIDARLSRIEKHIGISEPLTIEVKPEERKVA